MSIETFNIIATIGSMLIGTFGITAIFLSFSNKKTQFSAFVSRKAYLIGFLITLGAVIMSLIYSDIYKYPPCVLCWYQRIFIYPQVVLFGLAMIKKYPKFLVAQINLALTAIGGAFSLYHVIITYTNFNPIPCPAAVSCTQRFVFTFGFSTIPLMAMFLFVGLLGVYFMLKRQSDSDLSTDTKQKTF
ncbi:MAG: disulfide bond formation protein B [Candidatus Pacebacteria bacterium]|nr:disulfide bond formation protein B [Candidatus Paceibacterota bacterium]MBP9772255.1 disulfide bond formation protein B [Candidatus Paceibacterota bacterium]